MKANDGDRAKHQTPYPAYTPLYLIEMASSTKHTTKVGSLALPPFGDRTTHSAGQRTTGRPAFSVIVTYFTAMSPTGEKKGNETVCGKDLRAHGSYSDRTHGLAVCALPIPAPFKLNAPATYERTAKKSRSVCFISQRVSVHVTIVWPFPC